MTSRKAAGKLFQLQEQANQVHADVPRDIKVEMISRMIGLEIEVVNKGAASGESLSKFFNRTKRIFNAQVNTMFASQCAIIPCAVGSGYLGASLTSVFGLAASTAGLVPVTACIGLMLTAFIAGNYSLNRIGKELEMAAKQKGSHTPKPA